MSYEDDDEEDIYDYDRDDDCDGPEGQIDTTGVKMAMNEAISHLHDFILNHDHAAYCYAFVMEEEDGSITVVDRPHMPCWGAMREYETGTRPDDYWPEDLRTNYQKFPATGKPIRVAACFGRTASDAPGMLSWAKQYCPTIAQWNTFIEFVFNKEISPWRGALKNAELIKNQDGMYWGAIFHDTDIDPNIMVSLLKCNADAYSKAKNFAQYLTDHPQCDPRVAYLKCEALDNYNMSSRIVPDAWFNGTTVGIGSGENFIGRESYNRPMIEYIFGGKGNIGENISGLTEEQITALIPT